LNFSAGIPNSAYRKPIRADLWKPKPKLLTLWKSPANGGTQPVSNLMPRPPASASHTCAASVNATQVNMRRGLLRLISQLLRLNYNPCFCRHQKPLWLVSNKTTYFREINFRNNLDSSRVTGRKPQVFMIDSDSAVDKKPCSGLTSTNLGSMRKVVREVLSCVFCALSNGTFKF